eukprot:scaffold8649_cov185-Amphora_coffeaeformis.AAC.18
MKFRAIPLPFVLGWIVATTTIQSETVHATSRTATSATAKLTHRRAFVTRRKTDAERDEQTSSSMINPLLLLLRGGSTKASPSAAEDLEALRAYRWQQQLYLQSRSMQLRQALLARGLDGLHHSPEALEEAKKHVPVDWDCALATDKHPKSCLYSFDAEPGTKVVAPRDTTQWITLSALNRLRRNDPTKVEPLWHSQYSILATWLNPESEYSMYHHLNPAGALLSFLLDSPLVLIGGLMMAVTTVFLMTMPFWESVLATFLTSSMLWLQWPNWGRFLHAALPLKLLLGQMAFKFIAYLVGKVYTDLRQRLVELECQMWEDCMPLTILEGRMAKAAAEKVAEDETFYDTSMEMLEEEEDAVVDALDESSESGVEEEEDDDEVDEPEEFFDAAQSEGNEAESDDQEDINNYDSDQDDMHLDDIEDFYAFIDED